MRLFGKNPVHERLRSNPSSIRKIYIQEDFPEAAYIYKKAKQWQISVYVIPKVKMLKLSRHTNVQGIFSDVAEFEYSDFNELLEAVVKGSGCILFIDGLNDPQNLGAIMRSLACLGDFAIVLPTHDSVSVTEAVLRVACGGENYVKVARVSNLAQSVQKAKEAGCLIAGALAEGGRSPAQAQFAFPLGLVVGSEQKGIRPVVRRFLDMELTIPMKVKGLSLNTAQAATVMCYEIIRQKNKDTSTSIPQ